MPCLYCGKRVPLVRQISDRDFCSEEHRTRYRRLASSVLERLGGPLNEPPAPGFDRENGKTAQPKRQTGLAGPLPSWACFNMRALPRTAKPVGPCFGVASEKPTGKSLAPRAMESSPIQSGLLAPAAPGNTPPAPPAGPVREALVPATPTAAPRSTGSGEPFHLGPRSIGSGSIRHTSAPVPVAGPVAPILAAVAPVAVSPESVLSGPFHLDPRLATSRRGAAARVPLAGPVAQEVAAVPPAEVCREQDSNEPFHLQPSPVRSASTPATDAAAAAFAGPVEPGIAPAAPVEACLDSGIGELFSPRPRLVGLNSVFSTAGVQAPPPTEVGRDAGPAGPLQADSWPQEPASTVPFAGPPAPTAAELASGEDCGNNGSGGRTRGLASVPGPAAPPTVPVAGPLAPAAADLASGERCGNNGSGGRTQRLVSVPGSGAPTVPVAGPLAPTAADLASGEVRLESGPSDPSAAGPFAAPFGVALASWPVERPRTGFSRWLADAQAQYLAPTVGPAEPVAAAPAAIPKRPPAKRTEPRKARLKRTAAVTPPSSDPSDIPGSPVKPLVKPAKPRAPRQSAQAAANPGRACPKPAGFVLEDRPAPVAASGIEQIAPGISIPVSFAAATPVHNAAGLFFAGAARIAPAPCRGPVEPAMEPGLRLRVSLCLPGSGLGTRGESAASDTAPFAESGGPSPAGVAPATALQPVSPATFDVRAALGIALKVPSSSGLRPVQDLRLAPGQPEGLRPSSSSSSARPLRPEFLADPMIARPGAGRVASGLQFAAPDLLVSCRSRFRRLGIRLQSLPSRIPLALKPKLPRNPSTPERHLFTLPAPDDRPDYGAIVRRALAGIPRPVRVALMAIPVLLGLSALAPAIKEQAGLKLNNRAAFEVLDDFRKGAGQWRGATDWTHSPEGMVSIGHFALLDAGRTLQDYDFEFLGQIKSHGIGWAFRATDAQNYYGGELVIKNPGPVPEFALRRYTVVGGKRQDLADVPLPRLMHNDTPYRILVRVQGDGFATFVEGQMVDYWTDNRLKTGGVGFGASKEDRAYLYWVKLTYQNDWLGRLCARLAPGKQGSTE